jgi:hypothetical protein
VAAPPKAWIVFVRSNSGIVGSNPTQGMDACLRIFNVCVVLCVGSSLATGWSPVQGVLPTMYRIKNWKICEDPTNGLQSHSYIALHISRMRAMGGVVVGSRSRQNHGSFTGWDRGCSLQLLVLTDSGTHPVSPSVDIRAVSREESGQAVKLTTGLRLHEAVPTFTHTAS